MVLSYAERFAQITGEAKFDLKRRLQARSSGFDATGANDLRQFIQTKLAGQYLEENTGSTSDSSESETKRNKRVARANRKRRKTV